MTKFLTWLERPFWPLFTTLLIISYLGARLGEHHAQLQAERTWTEASFANGKCALSMPSDADAIDYYICVEQELIDRRQSQENQ